MHGEGHDLERGLNALRIAVARLLLTPQVAVAGGPTVLLTEATVAEGGLDGPTEGGSVGFGGGPDDSAHAVSSEESEEDRTRLIALVELARKGDSDAFG